MIKQHRFKEHTHTHTQAFMHITSFLSAANQEHNHPPWSATALPRIRCAYKLSCFQHQSCPCMSQHLTPASDQRPELLLFHSMHLRCPNFQTPLHSPILPSELVILLIQPTANWAWNYLCSAVTAAHLHCFVIHTHEGWLGRRKCILLMFSHSQHSGLM